MNQVILYIAASLDGFIARKDGDLKWLTHFDHSGEDYGFAQLMKTVGARIMGAKTYEWLLQHAPDEKSEMPTYVVTKRKLQRLAGSNVMFVSGDLSQLVANILKNVQKSIWLVGGGELTQSFLKEKLVDRIILSITPALIGDGIPLFASIGQDVKLTLISSKAFKSGLVQLEYLIDKSN